MTTGRTFTFSQYMHMNKTNNNMHNNDLFVTSLKVKSQINELQQFCVQSKVFKLLMLET